MDYKTANDRCIFKYVSGSRAYGTENPESDYDVRGIYTNPISELLFIYSAEGNLGSQTVKSLEENSELHEIRKFLKLASECNPNIIEFLYADRLILHTSEIWEKIRSHRDLFLSKKAKFTFSGYAIAQLKRIKSHRKYILNPPTKKPDRSDYGLSPDCKIPKDVYAAIGILKDEWFSDEVQELVIKEKEYTRDLNDYNSYELWRKNRNPIRQKMEDIVGYDVKHAMHLVRLINMCKEILTTNTLSVYRPDRELLMEIRNGGWTYDKIESYALESDVELNGLYSDSTLRDRPDLQGIQNLYYEICEEIYGVKI